MLQKNCAATSNGVKQQVELKLQKCVHLCSCFLERPTEVQENYNFVHVIKSSESSREKRFKYTTSSDNFLFVVLFLTSFYANLQNIL